MRLLPDILTNAGGVVVSYFEWVQNIQSVSWTEEHVNEELKKIMDKAFYAVWDITQEKQVAMRTGAYLIAVKRVVEAKKAERDLAVNRILFFLCRLIKKMQNCHVT